MANEIRDAKDGLKTRLETISGLRVLDYPADSVNEFPAAVVLFRGRNTLGGLGGSSFTGQVAVVVLISKQNTQEAFDELDKYMAPLGTESIEAAIDADNTWNAKVDDGRLVDVVNVGYREFPDGGRYVAADFNCQFVKQVTT